MPGRILLDTNIVIALFAGEPAVLDRAREAESILIPSIVLGELFYGAAKSGKRKANLARVEAFAVASPVLAVDDATARQYGEIKEGLLRKGRPIPENDIWVAALARQYNASVATRDPHFDQVEGIDVLAW